MTPLRSERDLILMPHRQNAFYLKECSIKKTASSFLEKMASSLTINTKRHFSFSKWEEAALPIASFLEEKDLAAFARTCKLQNMLIQKVRRLIFWKINWQKKALEKVMEERQKQNLYGKNLQELTELLEFTSKETKQKLDYLMLDTPISFEFFLRLSALCEKTAQVYVKIVLNNSNKQTVSQQLEICKNFFYKRQGVFKLVLSSCEVEEFSCNLAQEIELIDCKELKKLHQIEKVIKLEIKRCNNLKEISSLAFLQQLTIYNCESLKWIKDLPNMRQMEIFSCNALTFIEKIPMAVKVDIRSCASLISLHDMPFSVSLHFDNLLRLHFIGGVHPLEWERLRAAVFFFKTVLNQKNLWLLIPTFFFYFLLNSSFEEIESFPIENLEPPLEWP